MLTKMSDDEGIELSENISVLQYLLQTAITVHFFLPLKP